MAGRGRRLQRITQDLEDKLTKVKIQNEDTNGLINCTTENNNQMKIKFQEKEKLENNSESNKSCMKMTFRKNNAIPGNTMSNSENIPPKKLDNVKKTNKHVAKYSYKANPDSPGGFKELNLKQGEEVDVVEVCKDQHHWCKVKNSKNEEGFVPKSYLYKTEVTSLPWLNNKSAEKEETEPQVKFEFVPYKSAYAKKDLPSEIKQEAADNYNCEICNRKFNGPIPYRAHLRSKAHKEELELAEEFGRA